VTLPEKVGGFETRGSTAVFEIVVDDYTEVWVNGKAPFVLGQNGGRTLYLAAQTGIYRLRLKVAGAGALPTAAAITKN
jgi:hypothetical protein